MACFAQHDYHFRAGITLEEIPDAGEDVPDRVLVEHHNVGLGCKDRLRGEEQYRQRRLLSQQGFGRFTWVLR